MTRQFIGTTLVMLSVVACGGEPTRPRPIPAKLAIIAEPTGIVAGTAFTLTVAVQDGQGATATDAAVPVTIAFSGGIGGSRTLSGTLTRTSVQGIATFSDLAIDRAGSHTLVASTPSLTPATTGAIAVTASTPVTHALHAGDNQVTAPSSEVSVRPAVRISDPFGNGVSGLGVTFVVASGGGNVTGATQTTDGNGVATVGGWTLGESGTNTLTAAVTGAAFAPVTFSARVSTVVITGISPALLEPGVVATITGQGFSAVPAENVLRVEATPVTVTASTPTSITFTVPPNIACEPSRQGTIHVQVGDEPASRSHAIRSARQRTLEVGESLILADPAEIRCNELAQPGVLYYVNVFNTSAVHNTIGASWELRGAASGAALTASSGQPAFRQVDTASAGTPTHAGGARDGAAALHARILDENIRILETNAAALRAVRDRGRLRAAPARALAVGDMKAVRLPNVNANFCNEYFEINTRVAYSGTRAVILEDVANTLYSQIDSTYAQVGQEFDLTMFDILTNNFGDPLALDAQTDADGKIFMVFSQKFNASFPGLAGFVVSCDFLPRGTSTNQSSNFGQYFYARAPIVSGAITSSNTPPHWAWTMRSTIIHEVKHITSFGERILRGAPFEISWLEESSARLSEELFERSLYAFAQRGNIGYGTAGDPRGAYCGVRACDGRPRGIARVFEDLNVNWYRLPGNYSPLGRISDGDFSFYNTAWSLLRWAIDHSATPEPDFIKALIAGPERGIANLEARSTRSFREMLPEWTMAMALDDYPDFTPANSRLSQPGWNLRSIMEGLATDFPANYVAWPHLPVNRAFGSFSVLGRTLPGTAAFVAIGGVQTAPQFLELKAAGTTDAAPIELGLMIVRIQ